MVGDPDHDYCAFGRMLAALCLAFSDECTPHVVEEMEGWLHLDRKNSREVWAGGVVEGKISDNGDIAMSLKLTAWKKA